MKVTDYCILSIVNFQFSMETIAVTQDQTKALLAEAKRRAKRTKVEGGYKKYFKHVRGKVPSETDNKTSCAGHRLVRVVCGLRKCAGIVHKSRGNVHFAPRTKLARDHPRGVACFMEPSGTPNQRIWHLAGMVPPWVQDGEYVGFRPVRHGRDLMAGSRSRLDEMLNRAYADLEAFEYDTDNEEPDGTISDANPQRMLIMDRINNLTAIVMAEPYIAHQIP
jgi:hypothetical protein